MNTVSGRFGVRSIEAQIEVSSRCRHGDRQSGKDDGFRTQFRTRRDVGPQSRYSVEHGEWTLSSIFQPVFSLSHMRAVGYEGLLRAHDTLDRPVSPVDVFGQASRTGEALTIDRLTQALHLENFKMLGAQDE